MISFIIPTLNEEKVLEKTLLNLQEFNSPYEIIISDGGSTDNTIQIAKKYTNKIVKNTNSHKQTIAEGRNNGAFISNGDYIVEMDADTRFPDINHFFKILIEVFDNNQKIVGVTTYFKVYINDATFFDRIIFKTAGLFCLFLNNYLGFSFTIGGEFQMVRADAFRKIGGYDNKIVAMEDNEMFARLGKLGKIYFEKKLFIYHSGRRAHKLGWPRMFFILIINSFFILFFKKVFSKAWKEIR